MGRNLDTGATCPPMNVCGFETVAPSLLRILGTTIDWTSVGDSEDGDVVGVGHQGRPGDFGRGRSVCGRGERDPGVGPSTSLLECLDPRPQCRP